MNTHLLLPLVVCLACSSAHAADDDGPADLILHNARVVTVDDAFTIAQAVAVRGEKILAVGDNREVLALRGPQTQVIDLEQQMVLPGLIDSHVHSTRACTTEFDHEVPPMESIADVQAYIRSRAAVLEPGEWIVVRQVFITRLKEQRYPTRAELDEAAPRHPVLFSTGPDASVNSLALKLSGIDRDFVPTGGAIVERDPATGEPTGVLRKAGSLVKASSESRSPSTEEHDELLRKLFTDYNSLGITGVVDRSVSGGALGQYRRLAERDELTVRVAMSRGLSNSAPIEKIRQDVAAIAAELPYNTSMLRTIGIKTFLDGGMLTGSAYMGEPWGVSEIYAITDPRYRGTLYIEHEQLVAMVETVVEANLQFTAHSVGDGAVQALLDAYEEVNQRRPIAGTRPCITHSNFMTPRAIEQAARLGVALDIQPAWLWHDGRTLLDHFGQERMKLFQPLASIFRAGAIAGGGSDHMQKIGRRRSVNTYDPWLGMAMTITRQSRGASQPLHAEEALTREQAIRFYTRNNAWIMRLDAVGSLEPGKLADLIVMDRDVLACPAEEIADTQVLATYLGGKLVFERP